MKSTDSKCYAESEHQRRNKVNRSDITELAQLKREMELTRFLESDRDVINARDVAALVLGMIYSGFGDYDPASVEGALRLLRQSKPWLFRSSRADHGMVSTGVPVREKS